MPNKQPFYHRVTFLFTTTSELGEDEVIRLFKKAAKSDRRILPDSVEVEEWDVPEAGDPADLM